MFVELLHHLAQHLARVGEEGGAIQFVHGHQQLRGGALLPGLVAQGIGDREADTVGVTDIQAKAGALDGGAIDVEGEERGRQVDAFLVHLVQSVSIDALAAHHAIHICNKKVDELDLGMFLEERVRFVKLNGTRGYRHDATPFC